MDSGKGLYVGKEAQNYFLVSYQVADSDKEEQG
jgi:hypothetical protein